MLFQRLDTCKPLHVCLHSIPHTVAFIAEQGEDESEFHGLDSDDCVDEFEEQSRSEHNEGEG